MRFLFKLVLLLLVLIPIALVAGVYFSVEQSPAVSRDVELTPNEVRRAQELFSRHDPRNLRDGEVNTVAVSDRDLDLAFNYLVNRIGQGAAQVSMGDGSASVLATLRLPANPLGPYLNVEVDVSQSAGLPSLEQVRIGRVPIPGAIADFVLRQALDEWYRLSGNEFASDVVQDVSLSASQIQVTYKWDERIADVVRGALVSEADVQRLQLYNQHLVDIVASTIDPVPLAALMQGLFEVAAERSVGGDPAAENRAVILLLSAYVNHRGLERLAPEAASWARPIKREVTLSGRRDFAQHFMTSAALSALGGNTVSDAIGLYKEVDDSRGGSGFSFKDLGADSAGTRFGEWATSMRGGMVQTALLPKPDEGDFMPDVSDLPEFMSEDEFKQRFGGVGAPRYNEMLDEIEQRVAALRLYR